MQLNLQAHHNAVAQSDEFVMEALVSHGKVDALIHSLLVAEVRTPGEREGAAVLTGGRRQQAAGCVSLSCLVVLFDVMLPASQLQPANHLHLHPQAWREHAAPLLREHLARRVDSVISWSLLYHETAIANLLEVRAQRRGAARANRHAARLHGSACAACKQPYAAGMQLHAPRQRHAARLRMRLLRAAPPPFSIRQVALYHRSACEAASEDMLLELADWAYRKLAYLNSEGHKYAADSAAGKGKRLHAHWHAASSALCSPALPHAAACRG